MGDEKFTLAWDDFQYNAANVFSELRKDSEFSDVTLACNDDTMIRAHKVVLASCSPFFRKLFQQYNHPNPLIVLRGRSKSELDNVISYAYFGRVEVEQSKLEAFLQLAEEMNIKGLTPISDLSEEHSSSNEQKDKDKEMEEDESNQGEETFTNQDEEEESITNQDKEKESINSDDLEESIELQEDDWVTTEDELSFQGSNKVKRERKEQPTNIDLEEILSLVNSKIVKLQDSTNDFSCSICEKEYTSKNKSSLKSHIEAHPEIADMISLICSRCDRKFYRTRRFLSHTKSCTK